MGERHEVEPAMTAAEVPGRADDVASEAPSVQTGGSSVAASTVPPGLSPSARSERDVADLTFSEGRYMAEGFPLEGIHELHRYQTLVLEVAKQIWREHHPERVRLPEDFEALVRLRLTTIGRGSVIPTLEREAQLEETDTPDLLDLSINYIDDAFAQIIQSNRLPWDASPDTQTAFKMFGSSFEGREYAKFKSSSDSPILYTRSDHLALLDALRDEKEILTGTLVGRLMNLGSEMKFEIEDAANRRFPGELADASVWKTLHELLALRDEADLLWLDCTYAVRGDGTVSRIESVSNAGQFAKSTDKWALRLAELAAYPAGWLEGEGERVEVEPLQIALGFLESMLKSKVPEPALYPDVEGGIRMQWTSKMTNAVVRIGNNAMLTAFYVDVRNRKREKLRPESVAALISWLEGRVIDN